MDDAALQDILVQLKACRKLLEEDDDVKITPALKQWLVDNDHVVEHAAEETFKHTAARLMAEGVLEPAKYKELVMSTTSPDPRKVFARRDDFVRVKDQSEKYDTTKYVGTHRRTGLEVINPLTGEPAATTSELEKAKAGVLFKHLAQRAGLPVSLPEHEKSLLNEMAMEDDWAGEYNGDYYEKIAGGSHIKALLDDATSGGLELAPIWFDNQIVQEALLTGELYPFVNVVRPERGRRVEGGRLEHPTVAWGEGDDVQVALFDTTDMASAIDTTIYGAAAALTVGRDFLSDAGVDVGGLVTGSLSMKFAEEMDGVIAVGNGTTQPQGLTNASGITTVNTDNAATGPPTLNDYTKLMFGVAKQYRTPAYSPRFVSNDTTYQRSRSIQIDPQASTTDQRPVLAGVDSFNNYRSLGFDHKVQNDIGNRTCIFGSLRLYRLYLRQGLAIHIETGGTTLQRSNLALIMARFRAGGKVMDAAGFAKWTDGQS